MLTQKEIDEKVLYKICQGFIEKHKISGSENIYQSDSVILDAYEFIETICEIVGYYEYPEEID